MVLLQKIELHAWSYSSSTYKRYVHLCSISIVSVERKIVSFIIYFFEGNVYLYSGNFFSLYLIFKSFVMLWLVVIFIYPAWNSDFSNMCLNSFINSQLLLFIISSNIASAYFLSSFSVSNFMYLTSFTIYHLSLTFFFTYIFCIFCSLCFSLVIFYYAAF